jgi:hypothetical protein
MDAVELRMLRDSLGQLFRDAGTGAARSFTDELGALGWADVIADDPGLAWTTLFELKGELLSPVPALDSLLVDTLDELTGVRAGVVAWPVGSPEVPGTSILDDGTLVVDAIVSRPVEADETVVVAVAGAAAHPRVDLVSFTAPADLHAARIGGLDPDLGLMARTGRIDASAVSHTGTSSTRAETWTQLVAVARWALGAELVGVARRMVTTASEYAGARIQYGRPIGTFQAVQHRLAEAHAGATGAGGVVAEAARMAGAASSWTAMVAKALAGEACERAGVEAQQVFGAIGFTWEHDLHRALRRGYALDSLFGDWRTLTRAVGSQLLADHGVLRVGALI